MSTRKHFRRHADAGHGPDDFGRPSFSKGRHARSGGSAHGPAPHRVDRKALQLCRQVEHTLGDVLAGECDDEILCCLDVLGVQPAPDASRLLVTIAPGVASKPCPVEEVMLRLNHVAGHLRAEVASAITRKKAPTLIYQVIPCPLGIVVEEPLD